MMIKVATTKSRKETERIARKIAKESLKVGLGEKALVLALSGNLGAGKTTFVQGFARGLGIKEIPRSPTFILMQIFSAPQQRNLVHLDAYRLKKPRELLHLGFKEILNDPRNIVVIEWAEKVKKLLPKDTKWIYFRHVGKNKRRININSPTNYEYS